MAKLTPEQVLEIRRLAAQSIALGELAKQYQVSRRTINSIVKRQSWIHI